VAQYFMVVFYNCHLPEISQRSIAGVKRNESEPSTSLSVSPDSFQAIFLVVSAWLV